MSRDLVSFLVVFLISILGFGIAFHSLFPDTSAFSGPGATFLTLFNADLGGHEFETYNGHKYQNLGMFNLLLRHISFTISSILSISCNILAYFILLILHAILFFNPHVI